MSFPNFQLFELHQETYVAAASPLDLVLWRRETRGGGGAVWHRFNAWIDEDDSLASDDAHRLAKRLHKAIAAHSVFRETTSSLWQRIWRHGPARRRSLDAVETPLGDFAEPIAADWTDGVLVWSTEAGRGVTDDEAAAERPVEVGLLRLGANLVIVWDRECVGRDGIEGLGDVVSRSPCVTLELGSATFDPLSQAQLMQSAGRAADDRKCEGWALVDTGAAQIERGDIAAGVTSLLQAIAIANVLDESTMRLDAQANLGAGWLADGQISAAVDLLCAALEEASTVGDEMTEPCLRRLLGRAYDELGEADAAIAQYESLRRTMIRLNVPRGEAEVAWRLACACERCGDRLQAERHAQRSINILRTLGRGEAGVYAEHLEAFRRESAILAQTSFGPKTTGARSGGLLAMARAHGERAAHDANSRLPLVDDQEYLVRQSVCRSCPFHTGMRCRVTGEFTEPKLRLGGEDCPMGKWGGVLSS